MPIYEFRCRECGSTFTESRSMSDSDAAASCPAGHADTTRLLTIGAVAGAATDGSSSGTGSGGCCGGGCCG